jgi:regulator of protease activity HflC (stomatin/prohibitin superfamily)
MIRRVHIHEGEVGLRYRRGRFERLLEPGGHWLLGPGLRVDRIDARRRLLLIGSQEILTSDSVQLRLSAVVAFRVVDPARALHEVESYEQELHVATQLALRTAVGEATIDDLLEERLNLGERLTELVAERAPALGIEVFEIDVRDVMLPGDVKAAFAEVLRARAEGRAALERARGESAALRNLANAARLIDANPALMNLRLLQTMAQDAGVPGTTRFVVNLPESIAPAATNGAAGDSSAEAE